MITGIELNAGVSKKTGNAYSIGQLPHRDPARRGARRGQPRKGYAGRSYECPAAVLEKLAKLPFPVEAEVEMREEMAFGKPRMVVVDVKPGSHTRVAA